METVIFEKKVHVFALFVIIMTRHCALSIVKAFESLIPPPLSFYIVSSAEHFIIFVLLYLTKKVVLIAFYF